MAGHNKWTQIKRQKEKTDAAKSRAFAKFARLITAEAKKASGNRDASGLKVAIERAKAVNMPADNIERAIKKAMGEDAKTMESLVYEAYGPGGCALIIDTLSDSRNRTAQEIKHLLSEHKANLAGPGAASWAFEKNNEGELSATTTVPISESDVEALDKLVDALEAHDDVQAVYTNAE